MLSSEKLDPLDDDSDKRGSDCRSSGTYSFCAFSLDFDEFFGSASVLGSDIFTLTGVESKGDSFESGIFVPTGVESKGDIFASEGFVPTGVNSKGGQLINMF